LLADPLGEGWYDNDCDEPAELALLAEGRLRAGATVFDLGSHQAVVALMLADRFGPAGLVIAVEATPHNHLVSQRNLALNGANNVVPLHAAVARARGTLRFTPELNGRIGSQRRLGTVEVRAMSIDDLGSEFGDPDVLFIDFEGEELEALCGASRTPLSRPDLSSRSIRASGSRALGPVPEMSSN
jgi:FkbM family methyltransferase